MVFVKLHIPSRRLSEFKVPSNVQIISFEINVRKEKCLVASIYNTSSRKTNILSEYLTNRLEFCSTHYEKVIILGEFKKDTENEVTKDFLQEHTFYNMMK